MITKAYLTGVRFDSVVLGYALVLPVVLALIGLFIRKENYFTGTYRFTAKFLSVLFPLFTFILIVDYYYYEYFQSHINILIFGFSRTIPALCCSRCGAIIRWSEYCSDLH